MANPDFLDVLGAEMGRVYEACHDRLLINLARHFKFVAEGKYDTPGASFDYQARKLAEMGQVTRESVEIIAQPLKGGDQALIRSLEAAILDALSDVEPALLKAAREGLLNVGSVPPEVSPRMTRAFELYYRQSADKLNLVNTVMLESTENAYRATVSDIVNRMQRAQTIVDTATGQVVTGVESFNQALKQATQQMVENGITGFVDHGGHRWRPETYVAMDMRTTFHNVSREAFWERNEEYGNDLYLVSQHPGARPLCYPWQCKVISRTDQSRDVTDGADQPVHVYAQSETTYGEPAGLFGINCGHHPELFIPGATKVPELRQNEEENARTYAESQKQRKLEREFRKARLDMDVAKAQGDEEGLKQARGRLEKADERLERFVNETGRRRRREREYAPVNAKWPEEAQTAAGKALTDGGRSGTINTKLDSNMNSAAPMDAKRYSRMREGLEHHGIKVIQAKGDDLKYLDSIGAEASYGNGYIMHRGKIPSASAMFEETIHAAQARIYGEMRNFDPIELAAREIAAQNKLIANRRAYRFTSRDASDIELNLTKWGEKFRSLTGKEYDPNDRDSEYYRGV